MNNNKKADSRLSALLAELFHALPSLEGHPPALPVAFRRETYGNGNVSSHEETSDNDGQHCGTPMRRQGLRLKSSAHGLAVASWQPSLYLAPRHKCPRHFKIFTRGLSYSRWHVAQKHAKT